MTALTNIMRAAQRPAFAHDGTRKKLCHCCKDMLHGDDFRPQYFPEKANYCEGYFGGAVCTNCMDAWEPTPAPYDDYFTGYKIGGA